MKAPRVDCHSHVFNAEDLPIDGFIKKLSPFPRILTGIISVPLDRLSQWVARSSHHEAAYLASLLVPRDAFEAGVVVPPPQRGSDLVSDEELADLFLLEWQRRGLVDDLAPAGGLESVLDPDALLAEGITKQSASEERAELDKWLRGLGDPELEEVMALEVLEGLPNWVARMKATKEAVGRYVDALRLITKDRHLVAADLAATYPEVSLFVPALVDFEYTSRDAPSSPVTEQIRVHSLLSKVSVVGKVPGASHLRIHPIVGYCPYRELACSELRQWVPSQGVPSPYVPFADPATASADDHYRPGIEYDPGRARRLRVATGPWETGHLSLDGVTGSLDIVRHAVELGGFVGVKLYPPAGYLPLGNSLRFGQDLGGRLDAALRSLYAYCVRMEVPILAHANHSNGFEDGYDDLAGPEGWRLVLQEFPQLRLCLGHFGHLYGVGKTASEPAAESWVRGFVALMDEHPHVFADVGNSKFPVVESYRIKYLQLLAWVLGGGDPSAVERRRRYRVMFGTDYWMNTLSPGHRDYLTGFKSHYLDAFGEEAHQLFMGGNALRWLGFVDEEGEPHPDNANRQRLLAFYGPRPRPGWLG